jgi:hypothetical protein
MIEPRRDLRIAAYLGLNTVFHRSRKLLSTTRRIPCPEDALPQRRSASLAPWGSVRVGLPEPRRRVVPYSSRRS